MSDLKSEVLKRAKSYLDEHIFEEETVSKSIAAVCLKYSQFSEKEKVLFRTLFLEKHEEANMIKEFSQQRLLASINNDDKFKDWDDGEKEFLCTDLWIAATGIGCLKSGGMLSFSEDDMLAKFNEIITTHSSDKKKTSRG